MKQLRKLNKEATETFMTLICGLSEPGACTTFDKHDYLPKRSGGIMSVHVDCIGKDRYSVAHYFEQNGDLMSDPQMTFWVCDGKVYPCSYTLHSMGLFQNSIHFDENEKPKSFRKGQQHSQAEFVNGWMENIKDQQEL